MTWDHTTLVFCQLPKWKLDKGFLRKIKIQHYVKMAKVKEKFRKIVEITVVIPSVKFSFTSDGRDPYLRTSSASKGKCGIRKTIFSRTGQRTRKFSKMDSFFAFFPPFSPNSFYFRWISNHIHFGQSRLLKQAHKRRNLLQYLCDRFSLKRFSASWSTKENKVIFKN